MYLLYHSKKVLCNEYVIKCSASSKNVLIIIACFLFFISNQLFVCIEAS